MKVVDALCEPDLPVRVTVYSLRLAALEAVSVMLLVLVAGFGEKDAMTPLGSPETERLTLPVTPKTLKMAAAAPPGVSCTLSCPDKLRVGAETVTDKGVVAVCDPHVPLIVAVALPAAAVLLAIRVSVLFPLVGFGENDAVTPAGKPLTEKLTLPVKPFCGFTET